MRVTSFILLLALCICSQVTALCQNIDVQYAAVPRDQGLLLIPAQPDCPLVFEDSRLVVDVRTGAWVESFVLRNQGRMPIRGYTIAVPGASEWQWKASDAAEYILPGQVAPPLTSTKEDILPLTPTLRDQLNLTGPMKGIVVLLVARVKYADGSTFEEAAYSPLTNYFEKMVVAPARVPARKQGGQ